MITTKQLEAHALWLKTRFTTDVQGERLVAIATNLTRANLTDADLTDANLTDANLTRADLTDANLTRADLTRANLTRADLTRANLTDADLTDANLTRADLTDADLTATNLTDANLNAIEADIAKILSENPQEVAGLLQALQTGRIDGSSYDRECACLVGTIANIKEVDYQQLPTNPDRPAEMWFVAIKPGHTPENSVIAKITQDWIIKWMNANLEKTIDE